MPVRIATHWFDRKAIGDDVTLLWEPYVERVMRCNIWHVRGRERDLLVRKLPVAVVHGGHEPSFGRDRLHQIIDEYLSSRRG